MTPCMYENFHSSKFFTYLKNSCCVLMSHEYKLERPIFCLNRFELAFLIQRSDHIIYINFIIVAMLVYKYTLWGAVHYSSNHDALYFLLLFNFYFHRLQTHQLHNSSLLSSSSAILWSWSHPHASYFSCHPPTQKAFIIITFTKVTTPTLLNKKDDPWLV